MDFPGAPTPTNRPWDFVAGMDASRQEAAQREQQQFALERMLLDNRYRRMEGDRYGQMTPLEVEGKGLQNQETQARIPGVQATSRLMGTNADIRARTAPGEIGATNSGNFLKTLENGARSLEFTGAQSPMMADATYQQIYSSMPEQYRSLFPQRYDPSVPQRMNALSQILRNSPEHDRAVNLEETRGRNTWINTILQGANSRATASIRLGSKRTLIEEFNRAKNAEKLTLGPQLLADPDVPDAEKAKIQAAYQAAIRAESERLGRGGIDFNDPTNPGAVAQGIRGRLGADGPQAPFGGKMNIPGVGEVQVLSKNPDGSIRFQAPNGRTGTYRP
jgi:hypothetical protein